MTHFLPILVVSTSRWLLFLYKNVILHGHPIQYAIVARQEGSFPGVVYAMFLHASFRHRAANTMPLLILGAILCGRSRGEFAWVTIAGIVLGGGFTWLLARSADHV